MTYGGNIVVGGIESPFVKDDMAMLVDKEKGRGPGPIIWTLDEGGGEYSFPLEAHPG